MTVWMAVADGGIPLGDVEAVVSLDRESDRTTFEYALAFERIPEAGAETFGEAAQYCQVHEAMTTDVAVREASECPGVAPT